jgi:hypothetical protein
LALVDEGGEIPTRRSSLVALIARRRGIGSAANFISTPIKFDNQANDAASKGFQRPLRQVGAGRAGLGCRGAARPVQAGNDPVFGAASTGAARSARRATRETAVHHVDMLDGIRRLWIPGPPRGPGAGAPESGYWARELMPDDAPWCTLGTRRLIVRDATAELLDNC